MVVVPRAGETVQFGQADEGHEYDVKHIHHYPDDPDMDVYVVLKY
jgi:hypothetical protein